jgi:DNA-binding transcriptional LysR family regulator
MNGQAIAFDWNQARAFLATAEEGTLSAAARALGLTQPTLSRQVAALEEELGVALFQRAGRSISLSPAGVELLDHFRAMGDAAGRISLMASGQSQAVEGQVSITASDALSAYWLPPIMKRLREQAPGIEIEIVASNEVRDLRRREADIAIRHVRPEQPDLIARRVRDIFARLYASTEYLEAHGRPASASELADRVFVGFAPIHRLVATLAGRGLPLTRGNFKLVTDNGVVMAEMVRQGLGIGIMPQEFAERFPDLECVLPDWEPLPAPIWLVTHRELHTSRRIRIVFDLLAETLS